jgi:hypothetical protein
LKAKIKDSKRGARKHIQYQGSHRHQTWDASLGLYLLKDLESYAMVHGGYKQEQLSLYIFIMVNL